MIEPSAGLSITIYIQMSKPFSKILLLLSILLRLRLHQMTTVVFDLIFGFCYIHYSGVSYVHSWPRQYRIYRMMVSLHSAAHEAQGPCSPKWCNSTLYVHMIYNTDGLSGNLL